MLLLSELVQILALFFYIFKKIIIFMNIKTINKILVK